MSAACAPFERICWQTALAESFEALADAYPQGEAWVLAAFIELRSLRGVDLEAAAC